MSNLLMVKLVIVFVCTILNFWVSRKVFKGPGTHGVYRLLAWESILILTILNFEYWFVEPWCFRQIISWLMLIGSLFMVYNGVRLLKVIGKPNLVRDDPTLISIEMTTELVTVGIYKYIRHPLYSSLLFLVWGVFLKNPTLTGISIALVATTTTIMTAKIEEVENTRYFGAIYREYMTTTKMFLPHLF
jgi:protein-S-isoprenylcysteine O-methyltransferase Ste14